MKIIHKRSNKMQYNATQNTKAQINRLLAGLSDIWLVHKLWMNN